MAFDYSKNINPEYGGGVFYRKIKLTLTSNTETHVQLEDDCHALTLCIKHDGQQVVDIAGEWFRHPTSECPGALQKLKELEGSTLQEYAFLLSKDHDSRQHCTHFFDVAALAIAFTFNSLRDGSMREAVGNERLYTATVTDCEDGDISKPQIASLFVDEQQVLQWQMIGYTILKPKKYAQVPAMRGFTAWARDNLSTIECEHAQVLQKAIFVSTARIHNMANLAGMGAVETGQLANSCYVTQPHSIDSAMRVFMQKDFSDTPEDVLRFIP